jgi:uncharacterized membrane protein YqhA
MRSGQWHGAGHKISAQGKVEVAAMVNWKEAERRFLYATRLVTLVAVISSFAGALLMFWLGLVNTGKAFMTQFGDPGGSLPPGDLTVLQLIGALDRFLIAIVLMFFGYGVYVLFVRPGATPPQLGLPQWLHVESIGQLKQILAEVIIIVLFVLFLRVALETYVAGAPDFDWNEVLGFRPAGRDRPSCRRAEDGAVAPEADPAQYAAARGGGDLGGRRDADGHP